MAGFAHSLEESLQRSIDYAAKKNHEHVTVEHLLLALIEDSDASNLLKACNVNLSILKKDLIKFLDEQKYLVLTNSEQLPEPTAGYRTVITRAAIHVQQSGKSEVNGANVVVAIFSQQESFSVYLLEKQEMTRYDAVQFISHGIRKDEDYSTISVSEEINEEQELETNKKNALEAFCENLNDKAKNNMIDPLIGRDEEVLRLIQILCRRRKNNPLLVGDPGVGKSTVMLDILADLKSKGKDVLFISGEMNSIDMHGYVKRYPKFGNLDILFMGDYVEKDPLVVLKSILTKGWDVVLIDSMAEVVSAVADFHTGMTNKKAESEILTLLEKHNKADNISKTNTAFLIIQQVTKMGEFAGSNRFKHMMTGMAHLKFVNQGRCFFFSKNRRGGQMDALFFSLGTNKNVGWLHTQPMNALD